MKSLRGKYRRRKRSKYRMNCLLIDIGQYGIKVNNPDDILAHVFLVSIELPCSSQIIPQLYMCMCITKQTFTGSNIYITDSTHLKQDVKASK